MRVWLGPWPGRRWDPEGCCHAVRLPWVSGFHEEKREGEESEGKKKRVTQELGGALENHTLQSPRFPFCSVFGERPCGRKTDDDYL